jgi:hypothetical protein
METDRTKLLAGLVNLFEQTHSRYVPDMNAESSMCTSTLQAQKHCKADMYGWKHASVHNMNCDRT